MITPQFSLDQDETFVTVNIRVPYVKISLSEFMILEREFKFFLHPYYLNLKFDQPLKE